MLVRVLGRNNFGQRKQAAHGEDSAATITAPGMHADGDGLYLRVDAAGARRWVFVFRWQGRRKEMGMGPLRDVSLAEARELNAEARKVVASGRNPIEVRKARATAPVLPTFAQAAERYVESHVHAFRNAKHVAQWRMTLGIERKPARGNRAGSPDYCAAIRAKPVDAITTEDMLAVLKPVWLKRPETASRLRGRIERVLDAAKAQGHRTGENPAAWRGHLAMLLPKRQKLTRGHHAAMPYSDAPATVAKLRAAGSIGARALEFLILTVARTGEVTGARFEELDVDKALWIVPAERMKAGREHRVPLTARAVEIVRGQIEVATGPFLFSATKRRPISDATMTKALRAVGGAGTVHGLRSAFRDWAAEETSFPGDLAESALAHVVGDETERAYRRGDQLAKRRKLMEAWAGYVEGSARNVVPMTRRSKATA